VAENVKSVVVSIPLLGDTWNVPGTGLPFVTTTIEAKDDNEEELPPASCVLVKVNVNETLSGREFAPTRRFDEKMEPEVEVAVN